jgi:hypothetical protein
VEENVKEGIGKWWEIRKRYEKAMSKKRTRNLRNDE